MLFSRFLTRADKARIAQAIGRAEALTTGEIHVHVISLPPPRDILEQARRLFPKLGLHKTTHRNGVLILVSPSDKRFAIWGDEGIHAKAGQPLWEKAQALLSKGLAQNPAAALVAAVEAVGEALAAHFPAQGSRLNELPDDVSEG